MMRSSVKLGRATVGLAVLLIGVGPAIQAVQARRARSAESNKALVPRYYDGLNGGSIKVIDRLFARDYILHATSEGLETDPDAETRKIPGELKLKITAIVLRQHFPDGRYTVADQLAEGDKVVTHWIFRGTPEGQVPGVNPASKRVMIMGIDIHRIADEKIVEGWRNSSPPPLPVRGLDN
jgi:hypothetical protein